MYMYDAVDIVRGSSNVCILWFIPYNLDYRQKEEVHVTNYRFNAFRLLPSEPLVVDGLFVTDLGDSSSAIVRLQPTFFLTFNSTFPRLPEYAGFWKGEYQNQAYLSIFTTTDTWVGWEVGWWLLVLCSCLLALSLLDIVIVHCCPTPYNALQDLPL